MVVIKYRISVGRGGTNTEARISDIETNDMPSGMIPNIFAFLTTEIVTRMQIILKHAFHAISSYH